MDYTQYFLNLTEANLSGRAEWKLAYNFTRLYGMPDISPIALHNIANAMLSHPYVFQKYYLMNNMLRDNLNYCASFCRHVHHCAATQIAYREYDACIERALLATSDVRASFPSFLNIFLMLIICLVVV